MAVYSSFSAAPSSKYINVSRWFSHIDALVRLRYALVLTFFFLLYMSCQHGNLSMCLIICTCFSGITAEGQGVKVESSAVPSASTPDVADAAV